MTSEQLPHVLHIYQNPQIDSTHWDPYSPRNDDIVISTSLKSGTTWTQGIVSHLIAQSMDGHNLDATDLPDIYSSWWLDWRIRDIEEMYELMNNQQHRRFLKTHLPLDGLPFYSQVKYLVIGRDARDVFMSLWNHYSNHTDDYYKMVNEDNPSNGDPFPHCPEDIHDFWYNWITQGWFEWEQEGYPFWGNMHHTQTWWKYRHLDNIQFFHYADMLANSQGEIKRMAEFLDIDVSDEALFAIVQKTSLSAMRQVGSSNQASFKGGDDTFFFKGTNGRWRDVLSKDELAMYETTKSQVLTPECARWLEQGRVSLS